MKALFRRWAVTGCVFALAAAVAPRPLAVISAAAADVPGITCVVAATSINFGIMDPRGKSANINLDTTGYITFYCSNVSTAAQSFTACISLGNPDGNVARNLKGTKQRNVLPYNLYTDAARTNAWGSAQLPTWGAPAAVSVSVPANGGSTPVTLPVYASIIREQGGSNDSTSADTYGASYGFDAATINTVPSGSSCASATGAGSPFSFQIVAIVDQTCQVDTSPLIFDIPDGAPSGATATTTFSVACSKQSGYQVGLDLGKNVAGNTRRMRGGPTHSDYVSYQLFRDPSMAAPWGNSPDVDTASGSGSFTTFTIYGKVDPNQGMPSAGDYFDAVTVYVYF